MRKIAQIEDSVFVFNVEEVKGVHAAVPSEVRIDATMLGEERGVILGVTSKSDNEDFTRVFSVAFSVDAHRKSLECLVNGGSVHFTSYDGEDIFRKPIFGAEFQYLMIKHGGVQQHLDPFVRAMINEYLKDNS